MKKLKNILLLLFFSGVLLSLSSCAITMKRDNGNHRGWARKYDNNHKRNSTVWVIKRNHKKPPVKKTNKGSNKNQSKKQWDATK